MSKEVEHKENFDAVYPAHKSQADWIESHDADLLMDQIILEMGSCGGDPCKAQRMLNQGKQQYGVEFLANNLPAVQFVGQFYLELIIHGGLVAKDAYNQKKLDDWIKQKNPLGQTNGNVLRQALLSSIIYGYSGLRKVFDNVMYIAPNHFKIWELPYTTSDGTPVPGIKAPILYEIKNRDLGIEGKDKDNNVFSIDGQKYTLKEVVEQDLLVEGPDGSYYHNDGFNGANVTDVYVTSENFCHLRHLDEGKYGRSPLVTDRLRTTLIIDYLKNVIDEVNNDGNDYIMYLKQRGVVGSSLTSTISATQSETVVKSSADAKQQKSIREKQLGAARDLAKKLKRTQKTRIGIVSKDWVDEIEKLEGTVHLNEYLSILNNAKATIADIYGIPAMLAGTDGGGWSTGMSALIPFTLERTIKPFQQRYAEQLNEIVCECAGIKGDISFKELNWEDEKTRAEIDKIKAETEKALAEANSKKVADAKVAKETKLLTSDGVNGRNQLNPNTGDAKTVNKKTTKNKK